MEIPFYHETILYTYQLSHKTRLKKQIINNIDGLDIHVKFFKCYILNNMANVQMNEL